MVNIYNYLEIISLYIFRQALLLLGYRVIGKETAKVVLKHWLDNDFVEGCKSQSNVDEVTKLDEKYKG